MTYMADETRRMVLDGVSPITIRRMRRKLTQGDLVIGAGNSKSYLLEIESGKNIGSTVSLLNVASALNLQVVRYIFFKQ
ncbi:helix-turn-helix domain-containing protein [Komagataeibacter saccharivorans]|uniref:helix-turn-helix transcriptional regulator n=1 Tax=Komagataeibacter saccharivorans TaxID=265959 RepID=UPI001045592C|nr:helix-turn-helix transcriptional regulator [Komagataeibacter saccharivorans]